MTESKKKKAKEAAKAPETKNAELSEEQLDKVQGGMTTIKSSKGSTDDTLLP